MAKMDSSLGTLIFCTILLGINMQGASAVKNTTDCAKDWGLNPKDWLPCDTRCYNPSTGQTCDPERGVCSQTEKKCIQHKFYYDCYNPDTQFCDYGTVCLKSKRACLAKCFDPKEQICIRGVLCDIGDQACGGQCFNPKTTTKTCRNEMVLCDEGEEACGSICYSPAKGQTCHNVIEVCEAGQQFCGECYNPEQTTQICLEGLELCDVGEELCRGRIYGNQWCYNPKAGDVCTGKGVQKAN